MLRFNLFVIVFTGLGLMVLPVYGQKGKVVPVDKQKIKEQMNNPVMKNIPAKGNPGRNLQGKSQQPPMPAPAATNQQAGENEAESGETKKKFKIDLKKIGDGVDFLVGAGISAVAITFMAVPAFQAVYRDYFLKKK